MQIKQSILRASLLCPKAPCLFRDALYAPYGYGDYHRDHDRDHHGHGVYDASYQILINPLAILEDYDS